MNKQETQKITEQNSFIRIILGLEFHILVFLYQNSLEKSKLFHYYSKLK